ncbi:unnamed protein product [Soboliphyme baturini]|uniref:SGTA_dimer domain-containing protein n=1 Tax=Soboliphyme baturini TaxID=241478 RepID=A0A183IVM1_9BILA|nr:unnamed protein product [Soboliphyme baturini]
MLPVDSEKRFIVAFLQFLQKRINSGLLDSDHVESIEVAIQCLQSAFTIQDTQLQSKPIVDLYDLFCKEFTESQVLEPTEEQKAKAEGLKTEGNDLMKEGQFTAAVEKYTAAIKLYRNPIYFCNRAAAYSKLGNHEKGIEDCKIAVALSPSYSKAYGRMGLAYSALARFQEACDAYTRALELDPDNEGIRNNLEIAQGKLGAAGSNASQQQQSSAPGGAESFPNPLAGINIASLFSNPALMNMITQVMSNPEMQNA